MEYLLAADSCFNFHDEGPVQEIPEWVKQDELLDAYHQRMAWINGVINKVATPRAIRIIAVPAENLIQSEDVSDIDSPFLE